MLNRMSRGSALKQNPGAGVRACCWPGWRNCIRLANHLWMEASGGLGCVVQKDLFPGEDILKITGTTKAGVSASITSVMW